MRTLKRTCWLVLPGLLLAAPALAGERTWPATGLSAVELLTTSADLELRGWDHPEVKLESEEAGRVGDESQAGVLKLRGDVDLVLYLPAGLKVGVQGVSGDVRVRGLGGRLRVQTVSGDVAVDGAGQGLEVITVSGDVEAQRVRGEVLLKTVSGEQSVADLSGERLEASSVSGEIRVRAAELRELRVKSHSGDVDFDGRLDPGGQARLSSFSGDVRVNLPRGSGFELEA
ncbi:MAG TPA: DUF4097 family beta strand repeat-containing protein, partial [Myxococcota bacterium]|nr:DUF4097 family beta strand repeat-containing protein [Myxococcota bacterium]